MRFPAATPMLAAVLVGLVDATPVSAGDSGYVTSEVCATCHEGEVSAWRESHHAAAMQRATDETVLGRFDGATFTKDGITSTFLKKEGEFWVRTDSPDGTPADFRVLYTFGVAPLQQYLIEMPGGRLQALGIAWDARPATDGGQRWYHLYPDRTLTAGDPLHWTGIDQNWNHQCAWCHSTNLKKNYDPASDTFQTSWSEINVGCEACHGPGADHVAWASKSAELPREPGPGYGFAVSFDERKGISWTMGDRGSAVRSAPRTTNKEVLVCARCHARREQFSDDLKDLENFFDAFRPALIDPGLYHVDGQQRDEVYKYGSFLQSRMHAKGVTCSDCHEPHSGALHLAGNAVCTQCHDSERFDVPAHHHHASESAGAECVVCHMPATAYMGVDARHDHSIRIPRPDRTHDLAVPNACNQCHTEEGALWAAAAIEAWFPSRKPGAQGFAEAFDLGDRGAPGAQAALMQIAEDTAGASIVRASAVARLGRYLSPRVLEVAATSLADEDPQVRAAAVNVIAAADAQVRRSLLVPLLADETRLVRMDAARALAGQPERGMSAATRERMESAIGEYVAAQLFNAERPEAQANLGNLYLARARRGEARTAFVKALALDPTFTPAAVALAEVIRGDEDEAQGELVLRKALEANPGSGELQHALGLSLVRQKRTPEAMEWLAKAARDTPENPRFSYVYAVALHDTGRRTDATAVLKGALTEHPYDRDLLMTLLLYELEAQEFSSALSHAELLQRLEPDRSEISDLVHNLRRQLQR